MGSKDTETQNKILESGKKEFLEKGYKDGSLRSIAADAGVTTGAIYGYYKDKEALFTAIVSPAGDRLMELYNESHKSFKNKSAPQQAKDVYNYSARALDDMIDFVYDNIDVFKIIACKASGTKYEDYAHQMVEIEAASTMRFVSDMKKAGIPVKDVSENLAHMLANAFINSVFEIVVHDMPVEEGKEYVHNLSAFFRAGYEEILGVKV